MNSMVTVWKFQKACTKADNRYNNETFEGNFKHVISVQAPVFVDKVSVIVS